MARDRSVVRAVEEGTALQQPAQNMVSTTKSMPVAGNNVSRLIPAIVKNNSLEMASETVPNGRRVRR